MLLALVAHHRLGCSKSAGRERPARARPGSPSPANANLMRDVLAGAALSPQRNDPLEIGWSVALGCAWVVTSGQPCRPGPRLDALTQRDRTIQRRRGLGKAAACDRMRHFL
ncbi:hypothetical protein [Mesorhizobium sp.]|uniref:hypothetical protein n=1 Tax=Mesorhizobium sp. TaxID=1871066 RepID=UPI000FE94B9F|nr:hypothetical protein [Mesorhizobium sp.]RWK11023.1 MAG: hypothetical protein EOR39_11775 [Mesorhizobium sp.]TIQ49620.1 MAG: hypothetical protein E5X47_12435 [Mesorhizobium sp.]TIQ59377.1 MAG: hypothetical protein E5X46_07245 [Mesorhizobium sp.]TJV91642.1 MAG: hypothetical protein E5X52_34365 [Mesorhizobium sp.]